MACPVLEDLGARTASARYQEDGGPKWRPANRWVSIETLVPDRVRSPRLSYQTADERNGANPVSCAKAVGDISALAVALAPQAIGRQSRDVLGHRTAALRGRLCEELAVVHCGVLRAVVGRLHGPARRGDPVAP